MDDIAKKDILELITPYLLDRLGRIYIQNKEYQTCAKKAEYIYEKLDSILTNAQSQLLEEYINASNATIAVLEKLIHRQGMHDMLDLLISINKG